MVDPEGGQLRLWVAGLRTLLYYDGQWHTIMETYKPFFNENYVNPSALFIPDYRNILISIWSGSKSMLFIVDQLNYNNFYPIINHDHFAYGMTGFSINDITIASEFTAIEHFNGSTVYKYLDFQGTGFLRGIDKNMNNIFIVGETYNGSKALFIHATK